MFILVATQGHWILTSSEHPIIFLNSLILMLVWCLEMSICFGLMSTVTESTELKSTAQSQ